MTKSERNPMAEIRIAVGREFRELARIKNESAKICAIRVKENLCLAQTKVAQVSKPAVSPISKSARRATACGLRVGNPRYSRLGSLRYSGSESRRAKSRREESQGDSIIQPGVARHELPWVCGTTEYNPEGVESVRARRRCNPVGVENYFGRLLRVVRCVANPGLNDSIPLGLKPLRKI